MAATEGEEIERLIVRLVGDASNYLKMLNEAQQASKHAAEEVETSAKKVEEFAEKIEHFGQSVSSAIKSAVGFEFLEKTFEAFEQEESILLKLEATLAANGKQVDSTVASYRVFAEEMKEVTTLSAKEVMSIMQTAESFGVSGDAAKNATREAVALGKMTGSNAEAMLRLTTAMARGDITTAQHFARLVPQLRFVKDQAEFTAKYAALVGAGLEFAGKEAETTGGKMKQLGHDAEEFMAVLGRNVSDMIRPFITAMSTVVYVLKELPPGMQQALVITVALTTGFLAWSAAGPLVISQLTGIATALRAVAAAAIADPSKLLNVGTLALAVGVLIYGLKELVKGQVESNEKWREMRENIEKVEKAARSFRAAVTEKTKGAVAFAKELAEAGDPEAARQVLEKHLKILEQTLSQEKDITDKAMAERNSAWLRFWQRQFDVPNQTEALLQITKENAAGLEQAIAGVKQQMALLDPKNMEGLEEATHKAELTAKKLKQELLEQLQTVGMTEGEKKLFKLGRSATDELRDLSDKVKASEEASASTKRLQERMKELQREVDALDLSPAEAEFLKFKEAFDRMSIGEEAATKKRIKDMMDEIEISKQQKEIDEQIQRLDEEMASRAEAIKKSIQTPAEKQAEAIAELDMLLAENKLTWDEYTKAVERAGDAVNRLSAAEFVLSGSAKAAALQMQFQMGMPQLRGGAINPVNPNLPIPQPVLAGNDIFNRGGGVEQKLTAIQNNTRKMADKKAVEVKEAGL